MKTIKKKVSLYVIKGIKTIKKDDTLESSEIVVKTHERVSRKDGCAILASAFECSENECFITLVSITKKDFVCTMSLDDFLKNCEMNEMECE